MREKWNIYNKKADFKAIGERFGVDQVVARIVTNRDITGDRALEEYFAEPANFPGAGKTLKDCAEGAKILHTKIAAGEKILVIGDYDADGVLSAVILVKTIRALGGDVSYRIPHRITDGYGMNEDMVREAAYAGIGCIVTCDNGISATEPVKMAEDAGITVIITDHHAVPYDETDGTRAEVLPPAHAVINPHREGCPYPFKEICGAVVAMRFCEELLSNAGMEGTGQTRAIDEENGLTDDKLNLLLTELYDLAAVATTTDVMPLVGENRKIVKRGINKIPHTPNAGLRALCRLSLPGKCPLTGYDIGFIIGPCINAAGRVDTAVKAVELFLSENEADAERTAKELIELNVTRKSMTKAGTEKGIAMARRMADDRVLVVYLPKLHESIAGLVAGKVRESTGKPSIVVTDAETGAKGSCRSVEGYNIFEELTKVKHLFTRYGGHPLAAGFSLPKENIDELRRLLNDNCTVPAEDLVPVVQIDVPMPLYYVKANPGIIDDLAVLEPTGKANEKPVFAVKDIGFTDAVRIGKEKNFLRLTAIEEGRRYTMLLFRDADEFFAHCAERFGEDEARALTEGRENNIRLNIVYSPGFNEYNGDRSLQFVIDRYQ